VATGWTVVAAEAAAEVRFPIAADGRRRCYALGFVLKTSAPMHLELVLAREGGDSSTPLDVSLESAATYAGVVEFDALPELITAATVRLRPTPDGLLIHDLFVMSYG
jgi:hypothetical protein